jgi:protein-tyrosine-phosphatase
MTKPSVLFLCTGNSARSQMAEGFLRHRGGDRFDVASAGIEPSRVHPLAIAAMREVGIDICSHSSKAVGGLLGQHFAYLITVCDSARERCPIFAGSRSGCTGRCQTQPQHQAAKPKGWRSSGASAMRSASGYGRSCRRTAAARPEPTDRRCAVLD